MGSSSSSFRSPPLRVLAVLAVVVYVVPFDYTGLILAIPRLRADLAFSPQALPWVLGGYSLALGGCLVLAGRLGDLYGRRRLLLAGLLLFALASAATALASGPGLFLAARAAKGIAAALIASNALALLNALWPEGEERSRAYGRLGLVGGLFAALYLGAVAFLLPHGWRPVVWMNVPIALAGAALAACWVPENRNSSALPLARFDFGGALLSVAAFGTLGYGVAQAFEAGPLSAAALPWLGGSAAAFVLLAFAERRHPHPVFPPALLRLPHVVGAYLVCFLWSAGNLSFPIKLFVQDVLKYTPMEASLAFLPATLAGGLFARLAPGCSYWAVVLPAAMLGHAAFMAVWIAVRMLAVEGVPAADLGVASGAIYATQHLGNAVGVPALAAVLRAATKAEGSALAGFHAMFLGGVVFAALALAAALLLCRKPSRA